MTLVGDPRLIFLDEPTTGLDPRSRHTMWQIIRDLAAAGVTIFLTTQYLDEADQLADQIAVLDHGRLVAEGSAEELKSRIPGGHIQLQFAGLRELEPAARLVAAASRDDEALCLRVPSDGSVQSVRDLLDTAGPGIDPGRASCPSTPPILTTSSSPSPASPTCRRRATR